MSVAKNTTATCAYCDGERNKTDSVEGSYCSKRCYYKHKGEKSLNLLKHDHRLCASCANWLKEVEKPPSNYSLEVTGPEDQPDENEIKDVLIGFQYRTPQAEIYEQEQSQSEHYIPIISTGTGCECGITDTREIDEDLQSIELAKVLSNYVKVFLELHNEGQLDQRLDKDLFFKSYKETKDLPYSLGKGLYG